MGRIGNTVCFENRGASLYTYDKILRCVIFNVKEHTIFLFNSGDQQYVFMRNGHPRARAFRESYRAVAAMYSYQTLHAGNFIYSVLLICAISNHILSHSRDVLSTYRLQ